MTIQEAILCYEEHNDYVDDRGDLAQRIEQAILEAVGEPKIAQPKDKSSNARSFNRGWEAGKNELRLEILTKLGIKEEG